MFKAKFKIDDEIYPVVSLDFIDCVPFVVLIDRNGKYESYFNSRLNDLPHSMDFTKSLIIENSKYTSYEQFVKDLNKDFGGN